MSNPHSPTKRAPDAGDSAHIPGSFLRLFIFLAGRLRRPRPSAGNAIRWAAISPIELRINEVLMRSKWETYMEKDILHAHYEYLSEDEYVKELYLVKDEILKKSHNSVLLLANMSGLRATPKLMSASTAVAIDTTKYVSRTAMIGLGASKYLRFLADQVYRVSGMYITVLDTEEEAKN